LAAIDPLQYYVAGPRWIQRDASISLADNGTIDSSVSDATGTGAVIEEVPPGLGLNMGLAATVTLAPVSAIELQDNLTINGIEDVPGALRMQLQSGGSSSNDRPPYVPTVVNRKLNTFYVYNAGEPMYTLRYDNATDGTSCTYAMKFSSAESGRRDMGDPAVLANLGSMYEMLPEGWTFQVLTYEDGQDRYIVDTNHMQYVVADEFDDSFDIFMCEGDPDEADGTSSASTTVAGFFFFLLINAMMPLAHHLFI